MNFLAHLFLSGKNNQLRIGNFIGDWVKGRKYNDYPPDIRNGIILHRKIDSYTDAHHLTRRCTKLFRPKYKKYSGVVVDIVFDYFLTQNWTKYSDISLADFAESCYTVLSNEKKQLPEYVQKILPNLISSNRLVKYSTLTGLKESLETMSLYTSLPNYAEFAIGTIQENHEEINQNFILFFNELISFVERQEEYILSR